MNQQHGTYLRWSGRQGMVEISMLEKEAVLEADEKSRKMDTFFGDAHLHEYSSIGQSKHIIGLDIRRLQLCICTVMMIMVR